MELFAEAGTEKGKYVQVNANWPQAVLQVEFTKTKPQNSVVMENANEGEA